MFHTLRQEYFKIVCRNATGLHTLLEQGIIKPFKDLQTSFLLEMYQERKMVLSMMFSDEDIIFEGEVIEWLDENEIIHVCGAFGIKFLEINDHMAFKLRWL